MSVLSSRRYLSVWLRRLSTDRIERRAAIGGRLARGPGERGALLRRHRLERLAHHLGLEAREREVHEAALVTAAPALHVVAVPIAGTGLFYLVRAENNCPASSQAGSDSNGVAIPARNCP